MMIKSFFNNSAKQQSVLLWQKANGNKTFLVNHDLNSNSLVFELGGYLGDWSSDIFSRYLCKIYVFEPAKLYIKELESRFNKNSRIKIFPFGLSGKTRFEKLSYYEDSSSIFKKGNFQEQVKLIDIVDFLKNQGIKYVDLMQINIEGGEYELLNRLIESGYINKIGFLQIQFHDFIPGAENKMFIPRKRLFETHEVMFEFPFVWEGWKRK